VIASANLAAGALFVDETGRVLLVKPNYKDGWEIPGGYVEAGESPLAACHREILEELGRALPVDPQPLVVDWAPAVPEGDKLLFVFDGGELAETDRRSFRFADGEITEARFVEVDILHDYLPERLAIRLRLAVEARARRRCVYAEHGREPLPRPVP
jgi:ADP-ribose pyrophosphatase YjhB (NUDIX family)